MGAKYVFNPLTGNLDTTDVVAFNGEVNLGTAAAPSVFFTGDTNTGIYSPGPDQVAISTNGTGRLFVDAGGNVGIGAQAPSEPLEIDRAGGGLRIKSDVNTDGFDIGVRNDNGDAQLIQRKAANIRVFTNLTERLRLTSDGKVGLGTSSPSAGLHLTSAGQITSDLDTSGDLNFILADSGNAVDNGGSLVFAANNGNWRFAAIKGLVQNGAGNSRGHIAFSTRSATGDAALSEKLRITYDGKVGIGTTSPSALLTLRQATASHQIIEISRANSDVSAFYLGNDSNHNAVIAANNTDILFGKDLIGTFYEAARIDTSGRLLVGTSSARSNFFNGFSSWTPQHQVETAGSSSIGVRSVSFTYGRSNADAPIFAFAKHRSDSIGGTTVVQSGDGAGVISFQASDGTDFVEAAKIEAVVDGTPGANDMPGRLVFSTTADGASSPTERMRIESDGVVLLGTTSAPNGTSGYGSGFYPMTNDRTALYMATSSTLSNRLAHFSNPNGLVGDISVTGSATAYNTSSDYRLKENVVPLTGAAERVNQLQVHRFNFIADPDTTVDGFLAHEAQAVVPECVTGTKDEVDDEGNPVYQGIDQAKLVPLLTAALQEAIGRIETLEAEVAALKAS